MDRTTRRGNVLRERQSTHVAAALKAGAGTVSIRALADHLKLDKSAVSRRVSVAIERGYLKNQEDRRGKPARLELGEPMPVEMELLPSPEKVLQCCSVAAGDMTPPPPPPGGQSGGASLPADGAEMEEF